MWSRIPREARPVRIDAMSCWRSESAFSIRCFRLASTSLMEANCGLLAGACCSVFIGCISHRAPRDSGSNLDYTELGASFCYSGALIRRFLAVLAIIAWQVFYCLGVTDGKLTGLFVIGSGQPRPPELEARVFVHPNSTGYD